MRCGVVSASLRSSLPIGPRRSATDRRIVWRGERYLSLTQRRGGAVPAHPATGQPLPDVTDSTWWRDGPRLRLVLKRGEFWIEVETDLPSRDLKRIADTLTPY